MPSKIISIIGKPNVGKSSLFNLISGNHIAAETSKPHTTRHLIDQLIIIKLHFLIPQE
jgi:GTP-binding protein Era